MHSSKNKINLAMIFGMAMGALIGFIMMSLVPALETLRGLYQVSYTGLSVLISAIIWSHTAVQIPSGMIADRLGTKFSIYIGLTLISGGSMLPVAAPSFWLALLGRLIAGIGTGLAFTASMKHISKAVVNGRGGVGLAIFGACISFGGMIAYLLLPPLSILWGWQVVYWISSIICLPVAIFLGLTPSKREHGGSPPLPFWKVMHYRQGWALGMYHAIAYGSMMNLGNWVPTLLSETWQGSAALNLAWGGAISLFISGLGRLAGGAALVWIPPLMLSHVSVILLIAVFWSIPFSGYSTWLLAMVMAGALLSSTNFGAVFHLATDKIPSSSASSVIGLVNFLGNVGAIMFTLCFGIMKDLTGSVVWGFLPLTFLGVLISIAGVKVLGWRDQKEKVCINC